MNLRLLAVQTGISAKSGKRYGKVTLRGKRTDGTSVVADFWLTEKVTNQLITDGIEEDSWVSVDMELDENLRPTISGIFLEKGDEV